MLFESSRVALAVSQTRELAPCSVCGCHHAMCGAAHGHVYLSQAAHLSWHLPQMCVLVPAGAAHDPAGGCCFHAAMSEGAHLSKRLLCVLVPAGAAHGQAGGRCFHAAMSQGAHLSKRLLCVLVPAGASHDLAGGCCFHAARPARVLRGERQRVLCLALLHSWSVRAGMICYRVALSVPSLLAQAVKCSCCFLNICLHAC